MNIHIQIGQEIGFCVPVVSVDPVFGFWPESNQDRIENSDRIGEVIRSFLLESDRIIKAYSVQVTHRYRAIHRFDGASVRSLHRVVYILVRSPAENCRYKSDKPIPSRHYHPKHHHVALRTETMLDKIARQQLNNSILRMSGLRIVLSASMVRLLS